MDPYGQSRVQADPDGDGKQVVFNPRFPGQYADAESGLYYNWHRYYSPGTWRYVSSDPIGLMGGVNTYLYAGGEPVDQVDFFGLWSIRLGLYYGKGASVTFGYKNGKKFVIADAGFGVGCGFSLNPTGDFPRPENTPMACGPEAWVGFGGSAGGGLGIGSVGGSVGGSGFTGTHFGDGQISDHEGSGPYTTLSKGGGGFRLGFNGGFRIGVAW